MSASTTCYIVDIQMQGKESFEVYLCNLFLLELISPVPIPDVIFTDSADPGPKILQIQKNVLGHENIEYFDFYASRNGTVIYNLSFGASGPKRQEKKEENITIIPTVNKSRKRSTRKSAVALPKTKSMNVWGIYKSKSKDEIIFKRSFS